MEKHTDYETFHNIVNMCAMKVYAGLCIMYLRILSFLVDPNNKKERDMYSLRFLRDDAKKFMYVAREIPHKNPFIRRMEEIKLKALEDWMPYFIDTKDFTAINYNLRFCFKNPPWISEFNNNGIDNGGSAVDTPENNGGAAIDDSDDFGGAAFDDFDDLGGADVNEVAENEDVADEDSNDDDKDIYDEDVADEDSNDVDEDIDDEDVTTNNLGLAIFNDIDDLSILDDNMQVEQSSPVLSSNPPDTCSDNPELSANHILHPNEDVYIHNVLYRKEDVEICTPSPNAGTPIDFGELINHEYDLKMYFIRWGVNHDMASDWLQHFSQDSEDEESFFKEKDKLEDLISDNSPYSAYRKFVNVCGFCHHVFCGNCIFCVNCNKPLIKYCNKCGISEKNVLTLQYSNKEFTCNHIDRVSSDNTVFVSFYDIPGIAGLLFTYGFGQKLVCTRPSQVMKLVEHLKKNEVNMSLVDRNSSSLWDYWGFPEVANAIRSYLDSVKKDSNVLSEVVNNLSSDSSAEKRNEKQKVEESFLSKETTKKSCKQEIKSLLEKIRQFSESILLKSIAELNEIANHAFTDEEYCSSCFERCKAYLDNLKVYYADHGYIDKLLDFQDSISSLESKMKRINCKSVNFDKIQTEIGIVDNKITMNCRFLKMECLICASYYYSGVVSRIAKDVKEKQKALSSLLLSSPLQINEIEQILKSTIQLKEQYQRSIICMHDILYVDYFGTDKSFEYYSHFQKLIICCKKRYLYFTHNLCKTLNFEAIIGDCFQVLNISDLTDQARYLQSHSVEVLYIPPMKDGELFHYFADMSISNTNDVTILQNRDTDHQNTHTMSPRNQDDSIAARREKRFRRQPSRYGNTQIMESIIESLDDDKKSDYFVYEDPKTNRSVLLNDCNNKGNTDSISRMNDFFNDMDTNKDDGMISIYSHHMKIFGKKYEGKDNDSSIPSASTTSSSTSSASSSVTHTAAIPPVSSPTSSMFPSSSSTSASSSLPKEILILDDESSLPKKVKIWNECPPGHEYAVVCQIPLNIFTDGVEVFPSANKSVYVISATINNALSKYRHLPINIFRLAVVPSSPKGVLSQPLFRVVLGTILKDILINGKKGFYLEVDEILYHIYYGAHCVGGDLVAGMQMYDRPSCQNTENPCFQYDCVRGSLDPFAFEFVHESICEYKATLKSYVRAACHLPSDSIYRIIPFIVTYANDFITPPNGASKRDNLVSIIEKYMQCRLLPEDKDLVYAMYDFVHDFGSQLTNGMPIEVGKYERLPFDRNKSRERGYIYKDKRFLVNLDENTVFGLLYAYCIDYMHALFNISNPINSFLLGLTSLSKEEKYVIQGIMYNLSGLVKESSCYDNIYSSIPSIKENCEEFFSEFKNHDWITKKDLLIEENFRALNSHKHMLWCFSYFHLIFSKSMHIPVVRLFSYFFSLLFKLYTCDRGLNKAYKYQEQLKVCLILLEGMLPPSLLPLSCHILLHSFESIFNCGPLYNTSTLPTEKGYQFEHNNNTSSRNRYKTMEKHVAFYTFFCLSQFENDKKRKEKEQKRQNCIRRFKIFNELYADNCCLLATLTKQNYQDSYLYYHNDTVPFETGLDRYISNDYSISSSFTNTTEYYNSDMLFGSISWTDVSTQYLTYFYCGEWYYGYSFKQSPSLNQLPNEKYFAYLRCWDEKLHVFLMLGFIEVIINGTKFIQSICMDLPQLPSSTMDTGNVVEIFIDGMTKLNKDRLCLINIDRLYHKECRLFSNGKKVYFSVDKIMVKQSQVLYNSKLYSIHKE